MNQGQGLHEEMGYLPWSISKDRQLLDEAFLKEWYRSPLDSTASSGGEEDYSEDYDYTRMPRGILEPILTEVI